MSHPCCAPIAHAILPHELEGAASCGYDLWLMYVAVQEDALAEVEDMVELLKQMENPPTQLTQQQASTCRKAALLAIGTKIDGKPPDWMNLRAFRQYDSWAQVAKMSRHRMSGKQLQGLYRGIKGQREGGRQLQGRQQEEEEQAHIEACLAAAQVALQQEQVQQQHGVAAPSGTCILSGCVCCMRTMSGRGKHVWEGVVSVSQVWVRKLCSVDLSTACCAAMHVAKTHSIPLRNDHHHALPLTHPVC
jgi:hypothetical protein